jgi:hypothetical protein
MTVSLQDFARDFHNEIHRDAGTEDEEAFLVDAFTRRFLDSLAEAGEIADAEVCYYSSKGARLNGVCVDQEEDTLDLFVCIHTDECAPVRVEKAKVDAAFKSLWAFYKLASAGLHSRIEEVEPAFAVAQHIFEEIKRDDGFSRIRLFLLTDGLANVDKAPDPPQLGDAHVSVHIWDIERLFRWFSSGRDREEIILQFDQGDMHPLDCLVVDDAKSDYVSYLAAVPGSVLVSIYSRFGPRLLERNVRSFLQAKVATNKGIRETIREEPIRFFAYNNGITATASSVEIDQKPGRMCRITRITDLQIVNGGQTTASIFRAARKDKFPVDGILVPLKLNTVRNSADLDDFVGRISRFANTQNKVSTSDLSANDPFHRKLETMSRTVWAPAGEQTNRDTKWFYERARKQYADELDRAGTKAQKSKFEREYPKVQMFTKTDLAKYDLSWDQLPHVVSKGAQKCFVYFAAQVEKRGKGYTPDETYFHGLIARKILFDSADRIARKRDFGGYKANVVTYTIATLSHTLGRRLDFERIWRNQALDSSLEVFIDEIGIEVNQVIMSPPSNKKNIGEWCKTEECWNRCMSLGLSIPPLVDKHLVRSTVGKGAGAALSVNSDERAQIAFIANVPQQTWFDIAKWAKDTGTLAPWQRSLSFSLGKLAQANRTASVKQAIQGKKILDEALRLGFKATAEID